MPFRSEKQREYLKINHPDIYNRWKAKYGSTPQPKKKKARRKKK